jgi:lysosomal acid lipase/cholesteryl ester hydrolase
MYDDEVHAPFSVVASQRFYKPVKYPTRNIKTPIVLLYGGSDSLIDIEAMLGELPRGTVAKSIPSYEHLDFLWARDVDQQVFGHVFEALERYGSGEYSETKGHRAVKQTNGLI